MKPWQSSVLGILIGCGLMAVIFIVARQPSGNAITLKPAPTQGPLTIYVTGCVNAPGVYEVEQNSRVQDAIQIAGGTTDCANLAAINLAAKLSDEQQITIPSIEAVSGTPSLYEPSTARNISVAAPLDINVATVQELETLPGIGNTKAQAIIDYRSQNGPFHHVEDLLNVPGIGEKTLEQIIDLITTNQ